MKTQVRALAIAVGLLFAASAFAQTAPAAKASAPAAATMAKSADTKAAAAEMQARAGRLDGLVHCAGIICAGQIDTTTLDDWDRVMAVNLSGSFHVGRAFLPLLRRGTGKAMVFISSVCSLRPCDSVAYSVSKAGVDMLVRSMSMYLAREGIRVNAVNPGVVRSNLQIAAGVVEDYQQFLDGRALMHPLGRVGEPDDVASAVSFLLAPTASWITGVALSVDGGRAAI